MESSSDEESEIVVVQSSESIGLKGYMFQPRKPRPHFESSDDDDDDSEPADRSYAGIDQRGRLEQPVQAWCKCGRCDSVTLTQDRECLCCVELGELNFVMLEEGQKCITEHEDFAVLCQSKPVLRNVLVSLNRSRQDAWQVNPPRNRACRWAAYRQFVWWIFGRLGQGNRRVNPACAVHSIRETFRPEKGEAYAGYSSGLDSDSDM